MASFGASLLCSSDHLTDVDGFTDFAGVASSSLHGAAGSGAGVLGSSCHLTDGVLSGSASDSSDQSAGGSMAIWTPSKSACGVAPEGRRLPLRLPFLILGFSRCFEAGGVAVVSVSGVMGTVSGVFTRVAARGGSSSSSQGTEGRLDSEERAGPGA
eukprot:CAMPEP_0181433786 /NCGR_PEP_ID=MMETSP1110-20121109/19481_1 /TAXON_ID=174948 /ORGANISM="Symbiodinium sp., Strain CCMP421" /LENGTH=155 /DNA_ID=CAMNT_0023557269 /DNA_START=110 /DNA_END=573 /DNA_ORIENTATION=+